MYIKILVYIIDNQQIKHKISIPFSASWSFAVPVFDLCGLGGMVQKTAARPGLFRGGGTSRITNPLIIQLFYYICDIIKT